MIKKIIYFLVILNLFINLISCQDLQRFYETKIVSPPDKDTLFTQFYYTNNTVYSVNDQVFYVYPYDEIAKTVNNQPIQNYTIAWLSEDESSTFNIGAMAINNGNFFGLSETYLIKVNLADSSIIEQFPYQNTFDGIGGFSLGSSVYFPITSPEDAIIRVDADTEITSSSLHENKNINSQGIISLVFDDTITGTGFFAFVGDAEGGILAYDVANNKELAYYINPELQGGSFERYAMAIDKTRKLLYVCTNNNGGGLIVEELSYINVATTGMESLNTFDLIEGFSCSSAAMDESEGQIFFTVASSSSLNVIGTDVKGVNQGLSIIENVDIDAIYMIADHTNYRLTLFTSDEIVTMKYHSVCENDCSGSGICNYGVCECNSGYNGNDCSQRDCLNNCTDSLHGTCSDGTCICTSTFSGTDCSELRCPDDCFGHGSCSGSPTYTCTCFDGFNGTNCNNQIEYPLPPCNYYNSSEGCVDRIGCGWCHMDSECREGDRYGPYEGFCRTWYFDQNVETGVIILASIFIALISILYLIDIFSTIPIDRDRAKAYEEEFTSGTYPKLSHEDASILWWRDQRSAKAWALMDQFQFLSLISHLGVVFPSRFLHFTEYLDWTNLGIPFPPSINPPVEPAVTGRQLLSMYQYDNSLGVGPLYQLANILFWFGLLCGVFLIPLLLVFAILSIFERYIHWKEVLRNRLIHVSIRVLTFGYIGVLVSSCYSMVAPINDYRVIIPGAILFVIYGIGFPLALFLILKVPETRLHHPTFKQQFGCLYVNFKPKSDHRFFIFGFVKRFIMAAIIGILAFDPAPVYPIVGTDLAVPIVQVSVIVIALIGYVVILAIRKPYFDHFHQWLEYFLAGVNIVTVALCLTHIKSPSVAGELIAWILQALALVACIAAYMISWVQMRSVVFEKLKKFFKLFSCCKKEKEINMNEMKN